ncbi:MAG TPA: hypothetical protein VFM46_07110 [Pseudomonadales bacterium]|nr:hypothetical protein [Pseudomonadales bacterium]
MDYNLPQTLLLTPNTPFSDIRHALLALGFRLEDQPAAPSLLKDEPELASFSWNGKKPFVFYSFNPVAKLRVLDVATVPPMLRGAIVQALPQLSSFDVEDLLFDPDPRQRLLGLWALQESERLDLLPQLTRLSHDPDPTVAAQARRIEQKLERLRSAREQLLVNLHLLKEAAEPIIRQLDDPLLTPSLKPTASELAELFDPELAAPLMQAVTGLYQTPPLASPGSEFPQLTITAANAGLLRWPNELSDKFPRGYRNIAGWLNPKFIWFSWRWTAEPNPAPGAKGVQYDGMVWVERRWVWLPKVFRLLEPLLAQQSAEAPGPGMAVH